LTKVSQLILLKECKDNNYSLKLQINDKNHEDIIKILERLEDRQETNSCVLLFKKEFDISKFSELENIIQDSNRITFQTKKSLVDLCEYIDNRIAIEDIEDIILEYKTILKKEVIK